PSNANTEPQIPGEWCSDKNVRARLDVSVCPAQFISWNRCIADPDHMPIYEYACPKCRVVFNFLSKRINPDRFPTCPKCGNKKMAKQVSRFAMSKGLKEPAAKTGDEGEEDPMPDFADPRMERAMMELERDMEHMDENNPKHMAHMMRKMKDIMPPGAV